MPTESDLTTPLAYMWSRAELNRYRWTGLLRPGPAAGRADIQDPFAVTQRDGRAEERHLVQAGLDAEPLAVGREADDVRVGGPDPAQHRLVPVAGPGDQASPQEAAAQYQAPAGLPLVLVDHGPGRTF